MKKFDEPCENCMAETTGQCADKLECGEWQCYRELMKYQSTKLTPEEVRELAAARNEKNARAGMHKRCKWFILLCMAVYGLGAFGKLSGIPTGLFLWLLGLLVIAWIGLVMTDD